MLALLRTRKLIVEPKERGRVWAPEVPSIWNVLPRAIVVVGVPKEEQEDALIGTWSCVGTGMRMRTDIVH